MFKLKKLDLDAVDEIALKAYRTTPKGEGHRDAWAALEAIAQAAQLDGARQVVEWGDSDCPHVSHSRGKHWCGDCWQSLKELGVEK